MDRKACWVRNVLVQYVINKSDKIELFFIKNIYGYGMVPPTDRYAKLWHLWLLDFSQWTVDKRFSKLYTMKSINLDWLMVLTRTLNNPKLMACVC